MKQLTKEEIKQIQLEIMDSIHAFCEQHGLRYSLAFGTLIGAMRHKGYIPWDDDIDIMMPRPDYERFIHEYPGYKKNHVVQTHKNDKSYYLPFAKVYDNRTEQIIFPTKTGVFVDVFPIDGFPDTEEDTKVYLKKKFHVVFHDILYTCSNNSYRKGNKLLIALKYIGKRILYPSRKRGIKKHDAIVESYPYEIANYAGIASNTIWERSRFPKRIFEEYTKSAFEGRMYNIISNYDILLSSYYGDYMQLPPEEERVPGHATPVYWKE